MAVRITRDPSGIVGCVLDNPRRRNALTGAMLQTLCEVYEGAAQDASVRAIVLRGGHGTFCAGRDLGELDAGHDESQAGIAARIAPVTRLARAVRHCAVPTLAVVEGKAVGLGVALVGWCDLALAADDASFQIPEARAGIVPTYTAISLARSVGRRHALSLCLSGTPISAAAALACGLVQQTCPAAELQHHIDALLLGLSQAGPQALRQCKDLLAATEGLGFDAAIDGAAALSVSSMRSAEALQGMQAMREKRLPAWARPSTPTSRP